MRTTIVVVYKKTKKTKKFNLSVFNDTRLDDVLSVRKNKPLLPYKYDIEAIGVGTRFVEKYKNQYKIK